MLAVGRLHQVSKEPWISQEGRLEGSTGGTGKPNPAAWIYPRSSGESLKPFQQRDDMHRLGF